MAASDFLPPSLIPPCLDRVATSQGILSNGLSMVEATTAHTILGAPLGAPLKERTPRRVARRSRRTTAPAVRRGSMWPSAPHRLNPHKAIGETTLNLQNRPELDRRLHLLPFLLLSSVVRPQSWPQNGAPNLANFPAGDPLGKRWAAQQKRKAAPFQRHARNFLDNLHMSALNSHAPTHI